MNRKEILAHFQAEMDFKISSGVSEVMFSAIAQHVLIGRSLMILRQGVRPLQALALSKMAEAHREQLAVLIGSLAELADIQPALMGSGFKLLLGMVNKEAEASQAESEEMVMQMLKRAQQP